MVGGSALEEMAQFCKIINTVFQYHKSVAQFWGEMARSLSDSELLPMDAKAYGEAIKRYVSDIKEQHGLVLQHFAKRIGNSLLVMSVSHYHLHSRSILQLH